MWEGAKVFAIHISKAIESRRDEIQRLLSILPKVRTLIAEAQAAEGGNSTMSDAQWQSLRAEVERELEDLGVRHPTAGRQPHQILTPAGAHWSSGEVF